MSDNVFRTPNLDWFVDRFFECEPQVGIIGDIYESADVNDHVAAARENKGRYQKPDSSSSRNLMS
ncbi:hypothetical protein C488_14457 [Natrinema pellirubrum DSM 15624]|uniref:Uncharacterized protein n=1 Tax=Natrinema pellirubrum (strain DSM 15624 / CIP 106293 / JCM 10476 / NCIMB 786 / 157) TaxID=797303 RepID=L9YH83_NATP1|nr:hypothetical protein C488_14457 [Natrinema pellirubrum DSM 15624]